MADDFDRAKDLYKWNKSVFGIMGVWPLESTYIIFTIWILYIATHMSMVFADLYHVFGNLELMILNLSESTLETLIFVKLVVLRFSRTLVKLMIQIIDAVDARLFENPEERKIYLNYNRIAKYFFRLWFIMGCTASTIYHMKPLEFRLKAVKSRDETRDRKKPGFIYVSVVLSSYSIGCRSLLGLICFLVETLHVWIVILPDLTTFWIVWILQSPMIYVHAFHSMTIGYLFTLILHVCGQLSVLAHRIKNLEVDHRDNSEASRIIFRDIVERHRSIIRLARDIDKVFHLILLEELVVSTVIVGLTSYSVIVNSDFTDKAVFLSFLLYGATMLLLIYGYCVAGEYLITESTNVYEAYYQCQWQDVPNSFKKQLIICMIGASKPLKLTGGGFYTFSLQSFTIVLKTAASYISMLRKVIDN